MCLFTLRDVPLLLCKTCVCWKKLKFYAVTLGTSKLLALRQMVTRL